MCLGGVLSAVCFIAAGFLVGAFVGFGLRDHMSVLLSELFAWGDRR